MDKKYNSTTNKKYINNFQIFNLKSTSQNINGNNITKSKIPKYNNDKDSKSIEDFLSNNNLINSSLKDKSSNNNKNMINDELSLDNISNIIEPKNIKLPNTQMIFEDNASSIFDNNNLIPRLTNISNQNSSSICQNKLKIYDNKTKSFQMKMKKMKEMNKIIIKKNKLIDDSNRSENTYKSSNLNNLKTIIKCKEKIIHMQNKNKFIGNIKNFNSFNINMNNNSSLNEHKEIKVNKTNSFLCCYGKSKIN